MINIIECETDVNGLYDTLMGVEVDCDSDSLLSIFHRFVTVETDNLSLIIVQNMTERKLR